VKLLTTLIQRPLFMLLVALTFSMASCGEPLEQADSASSAARGGISLHTELGGRAEGYERACVPREFVFPRDHGAHPEFRNEWWYVTGNLQTAGSKRFGFHATFFRIATRPVDSLNAELTAESVSSSWASSEFYMAHFAIVAESAERVNAYERFGRSAVGLAGAVVNESVDRIEESNTELVKVWLDDWQLLANEKDGQLVWQLQIKEENDSLDLTLVADKPLVLQGRDGYSQKSRDPCNSSYYYSFTRLQASGNVVVDNKSSEVSGSAWLDREWSSSALADDQIGWDWFALQLDDGREIMFYQLRKNDGSSDPFSHAVEIDKDGKKTEIPLELLELDIDRWWRSKAGARYPVSGTITRKDSNETIVYRPLIDDQELNLTVRYWEGAIKLTDVAGQPIGRGYLELTGY